MDRAGRSPWTLSRAGLFALYLLFALVTAWQFAPLMPEVFLGDDLNHLLQFRDGRCGTRLSQVLVTACADKFRPVFAGFSIVSFSLFDAAISSYMAANVLIHAASATIVFLIARRLSGGSAVAALAIALAFSASRFAVFQVTQVDGPVESLALLLFLGMLHVLVGADEAPESAWRRGWLALLLALLAGHTHERYLVLAPGLFLAFLLLPAFRALPPGRLGALLAASVAIPLLSIGYKVGFLHSPFLVGTGGARIELDWPRLLEHLRQAGLSIFGVNEGPEYLAGAKLRSLDWFPAWIYAGGFVAAWALALGAAIRRLAVAKDRAPGARSKELRMPLVMLLLAGLLLAPAVATIRLEQRWLLAPFTLVLLLLAWAGAAGGRGIALSRWLPALAAGACSVLLDALILKHFDAFYLVSAARFADAVKRDVIGSEPPKTSPLVFIADRHYCSWILYGGEFFRVYGGGKRSVRCAPSLSELSPDAVPADARIFAGVSPAQLADVTDSWRVLNLGRGRASFDFLRRVAQGIISSNAAVSTPTGRGVFPARWDSVAGPQETLTVVTGYSYRFEGLEIDPGTRLQFGVGMIYPSKYPARAVVTATVAGSSAPYEVFSKVLSPPAAGRKPQFAPETVSLADYAGKAITLTFIAQTPAGDASGHWIGFAYPRLVSSSPIEGTPPAQRHSSD